MCRYPRLVALSIALLVAGDNLAAADPGQALALIESGRHRRAIELLQPLAERPGAGPDVLNNLAVAHAASGDWQAAESLLRRALGAHRELGTVHANLERLYTWRAALAYREALRDDGPRPPAPALDTVKPAAAPPVPVPAGTPATREAIRAALARWEEARRNGDTAAYLSTYVEGFVPHPGLTHDDWRKSLATALAAAGRPSLEQVEIRVLHPARAVAGFVVAGAGGEPPSYRLLVLRNDGDAWRITHELNAP